MSQITEQRNEESLLRWLESLDWDVYGGSNDHGDGGPLINDKYNRTPDEAILWQELRDKLIELNTAVTEDDVGAVVEGIKGDLSISGSQSLVEANRVAHNMLMTGRQTTLQRGAKGPTTRNIELIDLENIDHNSFITANQVRFRQDGRTIIPDTTLFINGIPIVQGELKSSGQGNQLEDAVRNLLTYEKKVPEAFRTVLFNFAAETHQYAVGAVGATGKHYYPWNRAPPEYATEADIDRFKQGARATLNRPTVRDILKDYVFFEERTGGITKIVPRHMQYYATESLLERVQSGHEEGETTRGLIWHTQGSGKSFTMLYAANRLLEAEWFPSPQVLLLVDTDDLREQMTATLRNIGLSHRFEVAESMDHLYELIENGMSKIILSTIQMFEEAPTGLQGNETTVILSDESHRFMEKQLGNRLEGALPDAHHYGFTGTPVTDDIRNTFENYSGGDESNGGRAYLDHYSIKDGIDDGVILPVHFEVRTDVTWSIDESRIDKEFEQLTEGMSDNERRQIIREAISSRELSELESRVSALSNDIHEHFQEKLAPNGWKGMVVTPSRDAAKAYGEQLRARFSDAGDVQVIISDENDEGIGADDAGGIMLSDDAQTNAIQDFKQDESPKLLVVCDKLLTGFDAPVLKAMYLDRNLKDHSLLQAIARVNRPASGKNNGLIVDYRGALSNLEDALEYDDEVVEDEIAAEEGELLHHFEEILDECLDMFESDLEVESKEDITQLVSEVAQDSERYKEKVNQLQNVYESLSPHGGLVKHEDTYRTLNRIRLELESAERAYADGGIVTTREQWGEKTLSLLEDTVDFETVEQEYPTFELDSDVLEEVSDIPDEINVIRVGKGIQQIVERKRQSNPRYKQLSERVKQVLEQWNDDIIDATEALAALALAALEEVQEHAQEIEEQGDNPDLSDAEYAIYLMLTDQYPEEVRDEEQAELIACEIERQFVKKVNRDFLGWKTDPDTQKEMRAAVISALTETDSFGLYEYESFVDDCVQYLVENHE
jgi:type I restriction enzyme R subunit